jgi:hypothetical protein
LPAQHAGANTITPEKTFKKFKKFKSFLKTLKKFKKWIFKGFHTWPWTSGEGGESAPT